MTRTTTRAAALLFAALIFPAAAPAADPATAVEREIHEALRDAIVTGYNECNAEKVLSLYDAEAQIATFTRGVLDKEGFAAMVRENVARNASMVATLEVGAMSFEGDTVLVPLRLIIEGTDPAGVRKTGADRIYCRLRKQGAWKILMQTYRRDYTVPADPSPPGLHH